MKSKILIAWGMFWYYATRPSTAYTLLFGSVARVIACSYVFGRYPAAPVIFHGKVIPWLILGLVAVALLNGPVMLKEYREDSDYWESLIKGKGDDSCKVKENNGSKREEAA